MPFAATWMVSGIDKVTNCAYKGRMCDTCVRSTCYTPEIHTMLHVKYISI